MTRESFIRKWLGNKDAQYTEQFRDEIRDDLDSVIEYSKNNILSCKCPFCSTEMNGIQLTHYKCKKCNEYFTN